MNDVIKSINVDGVEYDIQAKELTKVTYAELKELRDNGGLVAGHLYRITDYEFTTKQIETKSAGHVFDIIVLAVAENELSHIARAIAHEGDTYFDGNDLGAWELWYELDNDAENYAWAGAENGKGIIYRMIDEKRNDCPYDFKNALFYNDKLTAGETSDKYYYTFSYVVSGVLYDGTVEKRVTDCRRNSMGVYISSKKRTMNKNVWINTAFGYECYSNTFGNSCYSNTFGNSCYSNTFGNSCYRNTFGYGCYSNTFGNSCYSNTFGYECSTNTFRNSCHSNTFGNSCYSNTFGNSCSTNTFGNRCYSNTFGYECYSNTFGNSCYSNTFGNKVFNREVNSEKTSITLNVEYFDDGSGQLVPIKHPDLSTQPSILPYKFMGQYVYEQLIPTTAGSSYAVTKISNLPVSAPIFIEAWLMDYTTGDVIPARTMIAQNSVMITPAVVDVQVSGYARVVYTSMPEDGGYYYGGDSFPTSGILVKFESTYNTIERVYMYNGDVYLEGIKQNDNYYVAVPSDYDLNSNTGLKVVYTGPQSLLTATYYIPNSGESGNCIVPSDSFVADQDLFIKSKETLVEITFA